MKTKETHTKIRLDEYSPGHVPQIDISDFEDESGNKFENQIRLCMYKGGKYTNRPLITEKDIFIKLLKKAITEKIFDEYLEDLIEVIENRKLKKKNEISTPAELFGRFAKSNLEEKDFEEVKKNYSDKNIEGVSK